MRPTAAALSLAVLLSLIGAAESAGAVDGVGEAWEASGCLQGAAAIAGGYLCFDAG